MNHGFDSYWRRRGAHAAGAAAAIAALTLAAPGRAAFPQATCATAAFDAPVPLALGAQELTKQTGTPLTGPTDMVLYNFHQHAAWTLHTNGNVATLKPYLAYFQTESFFDMMSIAEPGMLPGSSSATHIYSGLLNSNPSALAAAVDTWNMKASPLFPSQVSVGWYSDPTVAPYTPPSFGAAAPLCSPSQSATVTTTAPIGANERHDGLLLGTGDTLYFSVSQPALTPMIISLDTLASAPDGLYAADFDLYVSTNTVFPDNNNYQFRGFTGSTSEALRIPPSSSARILYLGVHAYAGSGHFALHAYRTNEVTGNLCVLGLPVSSSQLSSIQATIASGSAYFLGMTNGNVFRKSYTTVNGYAGPCTTSAGCDVCVYPDGGTTSYGSREGGTPCGHITWHTGGGGRLFAHESGHSCYDFPDEYTGSASSTAPRQCGHTLEANNNKATGFCSYAHGLDGSTTNASGSTSNWERIKNSGDFHFYGRDFDADGYTADATPVWNNPNLAALVTFP